MEAVQSQTGPAAARTRTRRRIVLKVGSRLVTGGTRHLQRELIANVVAAVSAHPDTETVLVSSGAIAAGKEALGISGRPKGAQRQAAAAVGQARMMAIYTELFAEHSRAVGQLLVTHDLVQERRRFLTLRATFDEILRAGVVPIVNENDAVAIDDSAVGDNDNLAAYVAAAVDADLLVLLTDIDGIFTANPKEDPSAELITVAATAAELRPFCWAKSNRDSVGGMATKIEAAEKAARYGVPTLIANGFSAGKLESIYSGSCEGTLVYGRPNPLSARRQWMAMQSRLRGSVTVDEGAAAVLSEGGRSLLARGIIGVTGRFSRGDVIGILDPRGVEVARGISSYDHSEVLRIKGCRTDEIEACLGYAGADWIVHADNLIVAEES